MQAFENIISLSKAENIDEMDAAMMAAHEAINEMHLQKLQELERKVGHRLGVRSINASAPMEARNDEEPRRRVRDEPQA
jgi:hypothetical protein